MEATRVNVKKVIEKTVGSALPESEKNLFDLGLIDSFQSVNLIVELEKAFQVELSVLDFAENANFTLAHITDAIAKKRISNVPK